MSESIKDVLVQAKNLINLNGWHQGNYTDSGADYTKTWLHSDSGHALQSAIRSDVYRGHAMCTSGAINAAAKDQETVIAIHDLIDRHLGSDIPTWNDREERTKQEVLDLFDRVVESLDE